MTNTNTIVRRYMVFSGGAIPNGKSRKRLWRLLAIRKYIEWRKNNRAPDDVFTKFEFGEMGEDGDFRRIGSVFNPQAAIRAYRLMQNRHRGYPPHIDHEYLKMARIWLLKARLNYGRY